MNVLLVNVLLAFILFMSQSNMSSPVNCKADTYSTDSGENDSQRLEKAIEYFQSGKYHEALIIFRSLNTKYKLNPRFVAYLGVCYYYDWDYAEAALCLDSVMPQLEKLAPHERSVYYFLSAESHFNIKEYGKAISPYEKTLNVAFDNEKGDINYRLGFCHLYEGDKATARECFESADAYYQKFGTSRQNSGRIHQVKNMIKGLSGEH